MRVGFISSNIEAIHFIMVEMVRLMGVFLVIASSAPATYRSNQGESERDKQADS